MENMIKIYDVVTNVEKYSALFEEGSKRGFMLMTDDYIELIFKTRKQKHFALGDYIVHEKYGRFEITEVQQPKFNSDLKVYEYTLRFNAEYFKWKNKKYKFEPSKGRYEVSFSLTDKMDRQMSVLIANLEYYGWEYTWSYEGGGDASVVNANKYLTFDNVSIFDALTRIAEAFEVEWWVTDNIIHLGRCEIGYTGAVATFEVGKNVAEITGNNSEKEYFNVFTAFGSDRNLPTNYRKSDEQLIVNGVVQKRLMLPKETPLIYLDGVTKDSPVSQKVEGIVVFNDIFPKTGGEIASVTSFEENVNVIDPTTGEEKTEKATFYRFKDKTLQFDESYILGQTLQVVFSSGKLNGMTFDVEFNPLGKAKTDPDYQTFEIVRNENYGIPLPSENDGPAVGDKYTLVGFDATKIGDMGLITSAETELKARAEEYAKKLQIDPNNYTCTMLADYMYGRNEKGELDKNFVKTFELGAVVNLKDNNLFATGTRQSRVIGFEYRLDEPFNNAIITVGENATYSRSSAMKGEINAKLEEISFGGVNFGGKTGGGGGGTSIYIITSTSETAETDKNVYSALRTKENFANKKANDSISALWSFAQSSSKRGIQTHHYTNEGNEDNMFGKGFELIQKTTEQGNSVSRLEVDELLVRMRAVFASLEIRQMSYVGGNFVFSSAGSKLYHVVSSGAVWRCYLYSDDGTTATANNWKVNDQALCQTFDIDEGVHKDVKNKRYWRRVVSVGKEMISGKTHADGTPDTTLYQYVDLSKADCEYGSSTPEFGDTIVQFGNWTDKERQGIIYIMVVGENAPAIIEYANVGNEHFVWPEADTQISPRGGNIFKGKFYSVVEGSKNPITIEDQIRSLISDFEELKNQADKKMEIWFKEGIPYPQQGKTHIPTEPANEWTTEALKDLHVGDLYYDTLKQPGSSGGRAYRWTKSEGEWYWIEVTDQDTIAALEMIADVASDSVLSAGAEKTRVLIEWREAVEAYLKYSEQALDYVASVEKYKVSFDMRTPYESFREAFIALANMMNDGEDYNLDEMPTPIFLQDINTSTKIVADTYRLRWSNWHEAVVSILKAISGAAQALANKAQDTADDSVTTLVNMASDLIITAQEKENLSMIWDDTCSEYKNILKEWDNSSAQGSEKNDLINIFEALSDIMLAILGNMEEDSDLTKIKATYDDDDIYFNEAWTEYYERYSYVREQIQLTTNSEIKSAYDLGSSAFVMCDDMVSDGKLDPLEKIIIKREFNAAFKEKNTDDTGLLDRAMDKDGNYLVDVAPYVNAFRAWGTYLNGGTNYIEPGSVEDWGDSSYPLWLQSANMKNTNNINADTFRTLWGTFYEQRNLLITALANKAQDDADHAQEIADKKAQIFIEQPTTPYSVGDLWHVDAEKVLICIYARSEGEGFHMEDWTDFIEDKELTDKRTALAQFANVYQKRYGGMLKDATTEKVYISTNEQLLPEIALENKSYTISAMRDLYLASNKFVGVTSEDTGWSETVPQLDDSKKYLWHIVEATTSNIGMMIYGEPRLLHTFQGRDKIVKVKPYYQTIAKGYGPSTWSEIPVMPGGSKPCLWMWFELTCMEDDTYSTELGGIKFDGDTAYICTSDESRWSRPTMITDKNDSLFATLKTIQETFGGITITLYSMPQDTAKNHDLAIRIISYTDTFKKETKEGPCEILMYYNEKWELLQESVTAMIENLGDELRLIVFGADGENTVDTSGLVTQTKFNELFSQKVTLNDKGKVTNIDQSGLITTANFASLFSKALAADGTVVKKSEITAFVTKDEQGYLQSGVKIKADAIELEGLVTANQNFKILTDGSVEANGKFKSYDSTTWNCIEMDAFAGAIVMKGPSSVNDDDRRYPSEIAEVVELFRLEFQTDPDTLRRVAHLQINGPQGYATIDGIDGFSLVDTQNERKFKLDLFGITYTEGEHYYTKQWKELLDFIK